MAEVTLTTATIPKLSPRRSTRPRLRSLSLTCRTNFADPMVMSPSRAGTSVRCRRWP